MKNNLDIYNAIKEELQRERETLEMIASENFTSKAVLDVVGSILTNKYAEGYQLKDIMVVVKQLTRSKILQDLWRFI